MNNYKQRLISLLFTLILKIFSYISPDPSKGLPEEIFKFIGNHTPYVNIELIVISKDNKFLLTLRDDDVGYGWHIPGGIIRVNEDWDERAKIIAYDELGISNLKITGPHKITQLFNYNLDGRKHFISLIFLSKINQMSFNYDLNKDDRPPIKWHSEIPTDLLLYHNIYVNYLNEILEDNISHENIDFTIPGFKI